MKNLHYNRKKWVLAALVVVIALVSVYGMYEMSPLIFSPNAEVGLAEDQEKILQFTDRELRTITVGDTPIEVEVVTTPESTSQGLSGRTEIGADGMLFVFPTKQDRQFWMPEMQFDIDIVWIQDTTVVAVTSQVPKPPSTATPAELLPRYSAGIESNVVLELPSGTAAQMGIKPGTPLIY